MLSAPASRLRLQPKFFSVLAASTLTVGAVLLSGCSNNTTQQSVPITSAPAPALVSLQDVLKSHSYLTGKECESPETKRVSASMTVDVVVCDHAPSLKLVAVVGSTATEFPEAVSRFKGASQAMGENWMVSITPGALSKSDYRISGGNDSTEQEAEGIAEKLDGWVEVSPNIKDFYR